jgi:hypothetical protein
MPLISCLQLNGQRYGLELQLNQQEKPFKILILMYIRAHNAPFPEKRQVYFLDRNRALRCKIDSVFTYGLD